METMLSTTTAGPVPVSRYQLLEKLGEGGMAEVFRAEMRAMGGFSRIVALKLVRAHLSFHPDFNRWFMREAKVGGILAHPNLVETLDYGVLQDRPFIAMEYVEGPSLETLLERQSRLGKPFPLDVALEILVQICRGLDYAHRATDHDGVPLELVHRDLKPSNILISRFGTAKVADFGVARAGSRLVNTPSASVIRGTLQYMSPEQAWGRDLDHRSDLFSLGLILFELLTLEPFYQDEGAPTVLRRAQDAELDRRLERLATTPWGDVVLPVLSRAMARELEARYATAGELGDALEALLFQLPERTRLGEWVGGAWTTGFVKAQPVAGAGEDGTVKYAPLSGIPGPVSGAPGTSGSRRNEAEVATIPALPVLPISDIWPTGRPPSAGELEVSGLLAGRVGAAPRWRERHASGVARRMVRRFGMVALGMVVVGLAASRIKAWFPEWESAEGAPSREAGLGDVRKAGGGEGAVFTSHVEGPSQASEAAPFSASPPQSPSPVGRGGSMQNTGSFSPFYLREKGGGGMRQQIETAQLRQPQAGEASPGAGPMRQIREASPAVARAASPAVARTASPAVSSPAVASPPAPGAVALNSYPQASIRVDGRSLEQFPVLKLPLPAGEHSVSFSMGPGRELVRKVTVRPGAMVRCTAWFDQDRIQCRED